MPGTVTVRPIQAKLETTTGSGTPIQRLDPYCVAIVGNHQAEGKVCKKGGLAPHWDDSLSLSRSHEPYCYLEVKDKSLLKDKMLGVCAIDLDMLPGQETQQKWYDLYYQQKPVGEILVETVYTPEVSQEGSSEKMFIKEDYMVSDSLRGGSTGMMSMTPTNRTSLQGIYDEPFASDFKTRRSYDQNYSYESGTLMERTPESILPLRTNMSNLQSELRDMSKRVDEMLSKAKGMDYGSGVRDYSSGSIVIQSTQLVPGMLENAALEEGLPHNVPKESGINASHQEFIEERTSKREKLKDKAKELKQKIVTGMDHIKELAHEKKEELTEKFTHRRDDEVEYGGSPERKRAAGGGMKVKFFEGVEKFAHNSVKKLEEIEEKARGKKEAERREWEEARHDPTKLEIFKEKLVEEIVEKLGGHRRHHMVDEEVQTEISFGFEENVTIRSFSQGGKKKSKLSEKVKEFKEKIEEGVENIKQSTEEKKGHGGHDKKHHQHHGHSEHHHSHSHSHGQGQKKKKSDGKLHEGMEKLKAVAEAILSQLHHPQESGSEAEAEASSNSYSSESSSSSRSGSKKRKEKKKGKKGQKKTGLVKDIVVEGAKEGMKEKAKERAKDKVEDIKEKVVGEFSGGDDEKVEYDTREHVEVVEHTKTSAASGPGIKEKIEEGVEIVKEKLGMNKIPEERIMREEVIINEEENEKMIEQYIESDQTHTLKEKVIHGIEKVEEMFGLIHKDKEEEVFTVEEAGENQAYNVDWFKKKNLIEEPQQVKILAEEAKPASMEAHAEVLRGDIREIEADGVEKVKEFYMIPNTEKVIEEGQQEKEKESLLEIIKEKVHEGVEKVKEKLHLGSEEKHKESGNLLSTSSPFRSSGGYQMMSSPSVEHRPGRDIYHIPIPTSTHSYGPGGEMYDEMKRRYLAPEMMEPAPAYTGNVLTESLLASGPEPLFAQALNELTGVASDLAAMQQNEEVLEAEPADMVITEEIYEVPLGPQDSQGETPVMEVQKITVEGVGAGQEFAEAELLGMEQNQDLLEGQEGEMVITEKIYEVPLGPQDSQGEMPVMEVKETTVEEVFVDPSSEFAEAVASDLLGMEQNQDLLEGQEGEMVITEKVYEVPLGPQDSQGETPVMEVREIVVEEVAQGPEFVVDLDKEEGGVGIVQGPGEGHEGYVLVEEIVEEEILIQEEGEKNEGQQGNEANLLEVLENRGIAKDSEIEKEKVEIKEEPVDVNQENIENEDPNRFKKIFDRVAE